MRHAVLKRPLFFAYGLASYRTFLGTLTMTLADLVFAIATAAYIVVAIQFEERDLIAGHGPAHEDYRRRVPMRLSVRRRQPAGTVSPNVRQEAP